MFHQRRKDYCLLNMKKHPPTYLSLCSGVNDGRTLSRSSMRMKSLPKPSYLAKSIILDTRLLLLMLLDEEIVEKELAIMGRRKYRTLQIVVMVADQCYHTTLFVWVLNRNFHILVCLGSASSQVPTCVKSSMLMII